jgi:CRISPR-associated endonuclease/helicase Cas3
MTGFPAFFRALWATPQWPEPEPFPWQIMLADRAASGDWPLAINLPTASGKTACLDAAIFGLASTANQGIEKRLPRRIWFVVDRRIVVDEAFERAREIASRLTAADRGPLAEAAESLRSISGTGRPLGVARLRGGAWISKDWARLPSQPIIICSTVDQVGSALLFRAYGHSDETASIYAGLAAHDSLIILDEAHCAVPFMQTLEAVARYRDAPWAKQPLQTPFRYCVMSATPPDSVPEGALFPKPSERTAALDHPVLQKRIMARKLATPEIPVKNDADFVARAAELAQKYSENGNLRVAVMVNRVAIARSVAESLAGRVGDGADVILLTGRIRPLDRDALVERWKDLLKAGSTRTPAKPAIVVTTQCLEVGADFSFDALVTECASLDALRQRFGRLDRLGRLGETRASILIRERDIRKPKDDGDPIYGKSIYETWTWLRESEQQLADGTVDFGVSALDVRTNALRNGNSDRFRSLMAPWDEAPVLLPAHLDLLCQTSPLSAPEPDVSLFLRGKKAAAPEVRVVFRSDVTGENEDIETLSLAPPTSPEMLAVPLRRLKSWLQNASVEDVAGDVELLREDDETSDSGQAAVHRFVIWRGREKSEVTDDVARVRPNDIIVLLPSTTASVELGQSIVGPEGLGDDWLDLAEHAIMRAKGKAILRLHPAVLKPLCGRASVANLLALAGSDPEKDDVLAGLDAVLEEDKPALEGVEQNGPAFLPEWLREVICSLRADSRLRIEDHPAGGLILIGKKKLPSANGAEDDLFADAEDRTSEATDPISLEDHTAAVSRVAREFATRCVGDRFSDSIQAAAQTHDLGKLDWRFQLLLHGGDRVAASDGKALAKSPELPERKRRRAEIEQDARLPKGFRHEFLSMQLAEHFRLTPADAESRALALHLIASHHGYARPFAPAAPDESVARGRVGDLSLRPIGMEATLSAADRQAMTPADRINSGVPERFWQLTRQYGWWGLAYLEAVFRLSDWEASRRIGEPLKADFGVPPALPVAPSGREYAIALDALDGANPLAFLAALGTLRVLTRALPESEARLSWEQRLGAWRPSLRTAELLDEARLCETLWKYGLDVSVMFSDDLLAAVILDSPKNKKGEASWKDKLKFPLRPFRDFCLAASESSTVSAEFAAAWASETAFTGEDGHELAMRTRFDFTAGQQAFIGMLRELKGSCSPADLRRSLFTGWRYSTAAVSMRWDTQDEKRQYALQSSDPTGSDNPPAADLGANFIAVEALPLFPLVPDRKGGQAGFRGKGSDRYWSWPIWTCPISLDVVRSLLAVPMTASKGWPALNRREVGISTVFQSRIVMPSGRYRCFTPARDV